MVRIILESDSGKRIVLNETIPVALFASMLGEKENREKLMHQLADAFIHAASILLYSNDPIECLEMNRDERNRPKKSGLFGHLRKA